VLDVLAVSQAPLSVAQIHRRLGDGQANVVSVYRTVNLLVRMRLVRHTDTGRTGSRYELAEEFTGHHHHLICDRCGRIEDVAGCLVPDEALAALNESIQRARQFRMTAHELRLFGICGSCDA
jgi:Fur family ferric uptake transcriptional regulator